MKLLIILVFINRLSQFLGSKIQLNNSNPFCLKMFINHFQIDNEYYFPFGNKPTTFQLSIINFESFSQIKFEGRGLNKHKKSES